MVGDSTRCSILNCSIGLAVYMDVETFANSLDQVDNVEDLYICVECVSSL